MSNERGQGCTTVRIDGLLRGEERTLQGLVVWGGTVVGCDQGYCGGHDSLGQAHIGPKDGHHLLNGHIVVTLVPAVPVPLPAARMLP